MSKVIRVLPVLMIVVLLLTSCVDNKETGKADKTGIEITDNSTLKDIIMKNKEIDNIHYKVIAEYQEPEYAKSTGDIIHVDGSEKQVLDLSGYKLIVFIDNDDKKYISYMPDSKKAESTALTDEIISNNNPFGRVEGLTDEEIKNYKKLPNEKINDDECYVFEGKMEGIQSYEANGLKNIKYKIYFSIEKELVIKMQISSEDKVITEITAEVIEQGTVKKEDVKVDIPKDVEINEADKTTPKIDVTTSEPSKS